MRAAAGAPIVDRVFRPFQEFARKESASGVVLLACTAVALVWANSPWWHSYHAVWAVPLGVRGSGFALAAPLHEWINDGLMAVFFFLVGLEIKRELLVGELASARHAALPIAAAAGGMIVPALLYAACNATAPGMRGWGIPMATDIAFALGVVALLGSRVPPGLKVFLAALAIVDDIGAVLVIAVFYSSGIVWPALGAGAALLLVCVLANRFGLRHVGIYALLGLMLWATFLASGVHATVAGVLLAMTIPSGLLLRWQRGLHWPVAFLIMPLFALSNAGVRLVGNGDAWMPDGGGRVVTGVVLGLLLGKPLGITLAAWLAVRTGVAALPEGATWRALHGVSWLGGIGFTMSLFIAGLAFEGTALLAPAKVGIFGGSVAAGIVGWLVLSRPPRALLADGTQSAPRGAHPSTA